MQCMRSSDGPNRDPRFVRCVHPTQRRSSMGNPSAPSPALPRGRSTSTVRTRAQHPGPFGRAGHDQMLARSWRALKAGICSRRTGRHRGTPRELSARMRSASPQQAAARLRRAGPARRRDKGSHHVSGRGEKNEQLLPASSLTTIRLTKRRGAAESREERSTSPFN